MKKKIILLVAGVCFLNISLTSAQSEKVWFSIKDGMTNQTVMKAIENNTTSFLTELNVAALKKKKPAFQSSLFEKTARQTILDFLNATPMYCSKQYISEKCVQRSSGGYQVRNIPVFIPDAPEDQQNQEIVIDYTANGLINNITISIEETRVRAILEEYATLEDFNRRQIIIAFLENFRTAYNRKDIKYIETVFSDHALIITGKVVKQVPTKDAAINSLLGTEKIVYVTHTKKEYINNLKLTFGRNKYIDVVFDDIDVVSHPKNEKLYGVTLSQKWGSSTYNDTGYLFLMVDFKDEDWPMIHVRTWQPDKINGKDLSKDEIFKLNDFNLNF